MLRHLLLLLLSSFCIAVSAQSPSLCPNPPCAPGFTTNTVQNGIWTVKVKCYNTAIFNCYTVVDIKGDRIAPSNIKPGDTGVLRVNDANGRPDGTEVNVTFTEASAGADGSVTHSFQKK